MATLMKTTYRTLFCVLSLGLVVFLAACGATVNQVKPQQTVVVNPSFQSQVSPIPTIPTYRCGAWSSNNSPGTYSTILIYAKLTKNVNGVAGATANAVVHFKNFDQPLDQQPVSDSGGYVTFTLPLQGRQPSRTPTTVDVSFSINGKTIHCIPAFFTPQ